jgi:putative ABC transport system permease protein
MHAFFRQLRVVPDAVRQAHETLKAHPLRSLLGALAIFVAVATMAIVVTALDGFRAYASTSAARTFGSDSFVVAQVASSGRISRKELERRLQRNLPIRRSDVRFLDRFAGDVVVYAPTVQRNAEVSSEGRTYDYASVSGTSAELARIRDLAIVRGRFFNQQEEARAAQVAVIGAEIVDALFPARDPIGRSVRVGGRGFTVIGVQDRLGTSGGASLDRAVWVPLQAWERAFGAPATVQVFAKGVAPDSTEAAEARARVTMRALRRLAPGVDDTFDVLTPDAARNFVFTVSQRIGLAALPISTMALLAAIVVVTNTVLVSVSQRTREIGVRRALGATRLQITLEVLAESGMVAFTGGVLGILCAWGLTSLAAGASGLPLELGAATAIASLAAATASGVLAGWYPSRRAVRIDVIAALRSE